MMALIIGIAGNARVGKDTFCKHLRDILTIKNITSTRIGFADYLKEYLNERLPELGIDFQNLNEADKALARPIMILCAEFLRRESKGTFFVERLKNKIKDNKDQVIIIPDLRFNEYPFDELNFIQENGFSIFLERAAVPAAHPIEERNNLILREKATYYYNLPPEDSFAYKVIINHISDVISSTLNN